MQTLENTSTTQAESALADSVQRMVSRLRTPGLKADIEECVAALYDRVNNPAAYIPEAVADAKWDLQILAGQEPKWPANKQLTDTAHTEQQHAPSK